MSHQEPAAGDEQISLPLPPADRAWLAEELESWESRCARRIRDTPAREPVRFTRRELSAMATYVGLHSVLPRGQQDAPRLRRLYRRLLTILAEHNTRALSTLGEDARATLVAGVRLSEQQRESLVRVARLPPELKQRLAEIPAGTQFLPFGVEELSQLRAAIEQVLPRAVNPHRRRLQDVLERIAEIPQACKPEP